MVGRYLPLQRSVRLGELRQSLVCHHTLDRTIFVHDEPRLSALVQLDFYLDAFVTFDGHLSNAERETPLDPLLQGQAEQLVSKFGRHLSP